MARRIERVRCGVGCGALLVLTREPEGAWSLQCPMAHRSGGHGFVNLALRDELPPDFADQTRAALQSQQAYLERKQREAGQGHAALAAVRNSEAAVIAAVIAVYEDSFRNTSEFSALSSAAAAPPRPAQVASA